MNRITIILLLYLFSCVAYGGVYQWTDENGHIHFGSIPPYQQKEYSVGDQIKAAQPEQPVEKIVEIESPVQEKILDKPPERPQKINSTAIRKVSKEGLEALIIKLRHDAGKSVQSIKDASPVPQKSIVGSVSVLQTKMPVLVDSVTITEKPETKSETGDRTVANKKDSTTVALGKSENVKIAQPAVNKKPETGNEKRFEAKNKLAITAVVKKSIVALSLGTESEESSDLFGEEDSTDEANEIVSEENSDSDKCGLFMGFVEQYKIKRDEGCPGSYCTVYKQQLEKFKVKEKRYCS